MPLTIDIIGGERWDPETEQFVESESFSSIVMEHSLLSIVKWESHYHKPFIQQNNKDQRTKEELEYYFYCMVINNPKIKPDTFKFLTTNTYNKIMEYIADPMIGFKFRKDPNTHGHSVGGDPMTADMIYYYMIECGIPFTPCEKWHINRLFALIRICSMKNTPQKKMSQKALGMRNASLNNSRRAVLGSKG